jgi:hypothetical protein
MRGPWRALAGALAGALFALLIHPNVRPVLLEGLVRYSPSPETIRSEELIQNLDVLPDLKTESEAALWLTAGAEKINADADISHNQNLLLAEIALDGKNLAPDNAFWSTFEAVLQDRLNNDQAALEAWREAAISERWTNFESRRFNRFKLSLGIESNRTFVWHSSAAEVRRSDAPELLAVRYGYRQISIGGNEARRDAALVGRLLMLGSESLRGQYLGQTLIREALTGPDSVQDSEQIEAGRTLISSYGGKAPSAAALAGEFRSDAEFYTQLERQSDALMAGSVLTAALPGTLILVGLCGLLILGLGHLIVSQAGLWKFFTPTLTALAALVAGIGAYLLTDHIVPAIWTVACLGTMVLSREPDSTHARAVPRCYFWITVVLGFLTIAGVSLYLCGWTAAGRAIIPYLSPQAFGVRDFRVFVSLGVMAGSLAIGISPLIAAKSHRFLGETVGESVRTLGTTIAAGGLILGIVATPIAAATDSAISESLENLRMIRPD